MTTEMATYPGIRGRVAVVTGAARGIGREIARVLRHNGASVALLDIAEPADVRGPRIDRSVLPVSCDVTDEAAVDDAFSEIEDRLGTVTILVNNAGVLRRAPIAETSVADWRLQMDVNATGAFLCSRRVLKGMRAAGYGRIVTIGSSAGKTGGGGSGGAYAASKAAVMCLAKSIASEHAGDGITSNALAPTLIETDMIAELRHLEDRIPVRRFGRPSEVAALVAFLASADAGYITGEVVDINGGFLID